MNIVKYKYIVLFILVVNHTIKAQIPDFSKKQPEIHPLKFEGDRFWLSGVETENFLAGTVGEKVYFRENLCEITDFLINTGFLNGHKFILKCDKIGKIDIEDDELDEIVFLKSIENTTKYIQNKIYTYNGERQENYDLNGTNLVITDNQKFTFTKAFYCKVKEDKFSICLERDNGHIFEIDANNGRIPNQGRIALKGLLNRESFDVDTDISPEMKENELVKRDASADGLRGRKLIYRDLSGFRPKGNGKVVLKVCINRSGTVTHVEINELETTLTPKDDIKKYEKVMWKYKWNPDPTAPNEQCGNITFKVNSIK